MSHNGIHEKVWPFFGMLRHVAQLPRKRRNPFWSLAAAPTVVVLVVWFVSKTAYEQSRETARRSCLKRSCNVWLYRIAKQRSYGIREAMLVFAYLRERKTKQNQDQDRVHLHLHSIHTNIIIFKGTNPKNITPKIENFQFPSSFFISVTHCMNHYYAPCGTLFGTTCINNIQGWLRCAVHKILGTWSIFLLRIFYSWSKTNVWFLL